MLQLKYGGEIEVIVIPCGSKSYQSYEFQGNEIMVLES